jgi:hypothetical protein
MITEVKHSVLYWKSVDLKRRKYETVFHQSFKNTLNRQFRELADKITSDNYGNYEVIVQFDSLPVEKMLDRCWTVVGTDFAKEEYRKHKKGFNPNSDDDWTRRMRDYIKFRLGKKITSINAASREVALRIIRAKITRSTEQGWGSDQTAASIREGLRKVAPEINTWRALRIARTEVVSASNAGSLEGMKELNMPFVKYWIATKDARVRDTHLAAEQQSPINQDEKFRVGDSEMDCPGDMSGDPGEVINCRCAIAFELKRIA